MISSITTVRWLPPALVAVAGAVLFGTLAPPAAAQNYTFTGAHGYYWSDSFNWQNGSIPVSQSDTAITIASAPLGFSINDFAGPFVLN
jgi:hypothetical protein